jgi:two-component system response regulator HydG
MSGSRLALVTDDPRLSSLIGNQLRKTTNHKPFATTYAAIRDHLGPDTDGALVLVVTSPEDACAVAALVQEISLQKWPAVTIVLTQGKYAQFKELAGIELCLARRMTWPDDAEILGEIAQDHVARGRGFMEVENETLEQTIARRLLNWTPSLFPMAERIALAGSHDVVVLLIGETGTGKTFLARQHLGFSYRMDPFGKTWVHSYRLA